MGDYWIVVDIQKKSKEFWSIIELWKICKGQVIRYEGLLNYGR